jgi:hypothetical protein
MWTVAFIAIQWYPMNLMAYLLVRLFSLINIEYSKILYIYTFKVEKHEKVFGLSCYSSSFTSWMRTKDFV